MTGTDPHGTDIKLDWILDVLSDLHCFCAANGLEGLAAEIEDVQSLAAIEISAKLSRDSQLLTILAHDP